MKPFHYNQDPLYTAAAAILTGQSLIENHLFESWSDGYIDKYTRTVFNPQTNELTLTYRNYEQWPKKFIVSSEDAKKIMNYDNENQKRVINQLFKAGKLKKIEEGVEDWEGENPARWNPKERKELRAALESGKKLPYNEFRKLAHNYYKKTAKDHALNNLMTMSDQMTVDDVSRMFGMKLKLKDGKVFATKLKEGVEDFYSQKMIKNQLNTIVRNSTTCLQMIEAGREFPEWAQSEIAVAEDGIVSVAEFMESHHDDTNKLQK